MSIKVGETFKNSKGYIFVVNEIFYEPSTKKYTCEIEFVRSGYKRIVSISDVKSGLIRDRLDKEILGVACLGYANKRGNEKAYTRWHSMLQRCFNESHKGYKSYGAKGVTVCERWLRFDYFLEDLPKVDGYNEELFELGIIHLDKDIKFKGNKIYSLEKCCFVDKKTNDEHRTLNYNKQRKKVKVEFIDGTYAIFDSAVTFAKIFMMNKSNASDIINKRNGRYKDMKVTYV